MTKGLFIMSDQFIDLVYPAPVKKEIGEMVDIYCPSMTTAVLEKDKSILQAVEVLLTGWGGPKIDEAFLEAAPNLKVVFYAAGSLKPIVTDAAWERGIIFTTAVEANAVPVAEYTLSQILFSLKGGWKFTRDVRRDRVYPKKPFYHVAGAFNSTIGLISMGTVGRMVREYLRPFDVHVLAYDPFMDQTEAAKLDIEPCTIDDIFMRADVVSLHAPWLDATTGMITGEHFKKMKQHATFINTARGAIVREQEMLKVLKERQDITAILDVTYPEPPVKDSPLFTLPNVILTPHIAGSEGNECGRLGTYMLEELKRYMNGDALKWQVSKQVFNTMA